MSRSSSNLPAPTGGDFILYTAPDGAVKVDVFFKNETVWLTQKALAELFAVKVPAINKHLKNIFDSGELVEDSVISILETTAADSKNYQTRYYNLDAIIAVGYRVNSYQATQFRIWATKTLREFIIKGFVMDDERLKRGKRVLGKDYFEELLERIREIRASERRFYQKITDIYALSVDLLRAQCLRRLRHLNRWKKRIYGYFLTHGSQKRVLNTIRKVKRITSIFLQWQPNLPR
jgi:hypothetical protein